MRLQSALLALVATAGAVLSAHGQDAAQPATQSSASSAFDGASNALVQQLNDAVAEMEQLSARITDEKLPLSRKLTELESELSRVGGEHQQASRRLSSGALQLSNLQTDINHLSDQEKYLSGLLSDYVRKFDAALHIVESKRFAEPLSRAQLAPENANLSSLEVFDAQIALIEASLERLEKALGGERFQAAAVDSTGLVREGSFVQVGPVVLFRSNDGQSVGTVEQRFGSQEPTVFPFSDPADIADASALVAGDGGLFPFDPTMGDAHKMEATKETLVEHIQKGGPVMYPILGMAAAALLVALYKWLALAMQRVPSQAKIDVALAAVGQGDIGAAKQHVGEMKGPVGRMLTVGLEHIREPRELIEEAMYESMLTAKMRLQSMLPFVAICASSAPLLGLLGTVTGIINTFKRITVFGSGDVKSLSGGISEALITTEFGLIVAIPSLLLHAFLSRKARGIVGRMESTAVAFVNQVGKAQHERQPPAKNERRPTATAGV